MKEFDSSLPAPPVCSTAVSAQLLNSGRPGASLYWPRYNFEAKQKSCQPTRREVFRGIKWTGESSFVFKFLCYRRRHNRQVFSALSSQQAEFVDLLKKFFLPIGRNFFMKVSYAQVCVFTNIGKFRIALRPMGFIYQKWGFLAFCFQNTPNFVLRRPVALQFGLWLIVSSPVIHHTMGHDQYKQN